MGGGAEPKSRPSRLAFHHRQCPHETETFVSKDSCLTEYYGFLINQGVQEGWVTAHCSTVQVVTPYDNVVTIMHEGASGGGKSEMLEQIHREPDGRLLLGVNILTGEHRYLEIPRACRLRAWLGDEPNAINRDPARVQIASGDG